MKQLSPEAIWHMDAMELESVLVSGAPSRVPRKIRFYAPSFMHYKTSYYESTCRDFPTISITGSSCALKCRHCAGRVLDSMYSATTPKKLFEVCLRLKREGAVGCLISGGCLPDGSVPIGEFIDAIGKVKRELGLIILVHTGIVDSSTAKALKRNNVDSALIDIIGSDETIREICNLDVSVSDYADSLSALQAARMDFVPHVIAGLHYGKLKGELKALEMVSKHSPSALVIIAFMPIHGTMMEKTEPPSPLDIAKVVAAARLMLPKTPLVLGCMRPRGKSRVETDVLAIRAGADAVAFPTEDAIKYAESHGYSVLFSPLCCSQIYMDAKRDSLR